MAMIGIDLGTSNSLVGCWKDDNAILIPNSFGDYLTPSVVGIDDTNEILIGKIARERLMTHPTKTVAVFKRFMGTSKVYQMGRKSFTPTELSALVLGSLKGDAEEFLKEECNEAVISVPAYFNSIQREATMDAARLAGFESISLISEPTAAALSYGMDNLEEDSTILVLDLGGGTFDVTLLEMFEGIMQVKAIAGDNRLGGEDFTRAIVRECLKYNQLQDFLISPDDMAALYRKVEQAKRNITNFNTIEIQFQIEGKTWAYEIKADQIKVFWNPLLERMKSPIIKALSDGKTKVKDVDKVIMIGGATKSLIIRQYIGKLLGQLPYAEANPDQAVGVGAAVQTALKTGEDHLTEMMLTDVCGYTLGIDTTKSEKGQYVKGFLSPIIERNSTVPISRVQRYHSLVPDQECLRAVVYQGESPHVKDNICLGEIEVPLPQTGEIEEVDIRFTYDINGLLEVEVEVVSTGKKEQLIIQNSTRKLTQQEIQMQLEKLKSLKIHPRDKAENRLLMARAERLYIESLGYKREMIQEGIKTFELALDRQDPIEIKKAAVVFNQFLNGIEEDREL